MPAVCYLFSAIFLLVLSINQSNAEPTRYQTPLEKVQWQFSGNVFGCQLTQEVSGFGKLSLNLQPGAQPQLELKADWLSNPGITRASIISSSWATDNGPQAHTDMVWLGNLAQAKGQSLNRFVEALEQGYSWQVDIQDSADIAYQITAAPVNVSSALQAFRQCRRDLLPQPFEYVRQREIRFSSASSMLVADAEQDLRAIARYVKADPEISAILVDGHADGQGNRLANLVLSQERAQNVASRLIELGLNSEQLQVFHHGNRQPIASDNSEAGRKLNRRVTVRLVKGGSPAQESVQ